MAGAYTDIVDIVAPSSAVAGARVDITVKIKNTYSSAIGIMVGGALEYGVTPWPQITYPTNSGNVNGGATKSFSGYFTMPNKAVTIHAYSYYYGVDNAWHFDDEATKNVSLGVVFKGTITKKELDYEDSWRPVPIYNIPTGTRVRVRITGRNDMASNQKMGVWWQVKDPGGYVVDEYSKWETSWTGPSNAQEFVGSSFDLNKVGTYTLIIALSMNPSDPVIVDDYYGTLCTVKAAVPTPEFSGFGVKDYSKK